MVSRHSFGGLISDSVGMSVLGLKEKRSDRMGQIDTGCGFLVSPGCLASFSFDLSWTESARFCFSTDNRVEPAHLSSGFAWRCLSHLSQVVPVFPLSLCILLSRPPHVESLALIFVKHLSLSAGTPRGLQGRCLAVSFQNDALGGLARMT